MSSILSMVTHWHLLEPGEVITRDMVPATPIREKMGRQSKKTLKQQRAAYHQQK